MIQRLIIYTCLISMLILTGCKGTGESSEPVLPENEPQTEAEVGEMINITITAGGQSFQAKLYDNETTRAFLERLPMTVDMGELNSNEKYAYLSNSLPVNSGNPSTIHTGDIMLFGSDCLVLFYEDFSTAYSYTTLGYVEDISGFKEALGEGSVQVGFSIE